jgi:hypothetical protein
MPEARAPSPADQASPRAGEQWNNRRDHELFSGNRRRRRPARDQWRAAGAGLQPIGRLLRRPARGEARRTGSGQRRRCGCRPFRPSPLCSAREAALLRLRFFATRDRRRRHPLADGTPATAVLSCLRADGDVSSVPRLTRRRDAPTPLP